MIEADNRSGVDVPLERLTELARFLFGRLRLHPRTELAISLVDEQEMERLHLKWMDEPGSTDVLSFPMDQLRAPHVGEHARPGVLGDIVICPQVAARQAAAAGHGDQAELDLLLTHGVLHLLGHDHAEPDGHATMFALQAELLGAWRGGSP